MIRGYGLHNKISILDKAYYPMVPLRVSCALLFEDRNFQIAFSPKGLVRFFRDAYQIKEVELNFHEVLAVFRVLFFSWRKTKAGRGAGLMRYAVILTSLKILFVQLCLFDTTACSSFSHQNYYKWPTFRL